MLIIKQDSSVSKTQKMRRPPNPFSLLELIPQEEKLEIRPGRKKLSFGVPKETQFEEKRVSLTPSLVSLLTSMGNDILIESTAGENAGYSDEDYSKAGASIVFKAEEAFACPFVIKIAPPSLKEIDMMSINSVLASSLQMKIQTPEYFYKLSLKKINAVAFDTLKNNKNESFILKSISEIAGRSSILIASELLSQTQGLLLGGASGVPPVSILIIGAGTVGTYAAKTALGLGANVKVFDDSIAKIRDLMDKVNSPIYTSTLNPYDLSKAVADSDVIIGAIRGRNRAPQVISEAMVESMREGSVIVDVCIDRGGCFETSRHTSHSNPTYLKHGITHYCVPNITSKYAKTASISISNSAAPMLLELCNAGGFDSIIRRNRNFLNGIYFYKGILTSKAVGRWFNLEYKDINLLID